MQKNREHHEDSLTSEKILAKIEVIMAVITSILAKIFIYLLRLVQLAWFFSHFITTFLPVMM